MATASSIRHARRLTLKEHRMAMRQLRDTARVERVAMQAGQLIGGRMQRQAVKALRHGQPVGQVVHDQIESARTLLIELMVVAHLQGRRRTTINAAPKIVQRGLRMAAVYDGALDFLKRRLAVSDDELNRLRLQYGQEAMRVVGQLENAVEKKIVQAVHDAAAQGLHLKDAVKGMREAFRAAGVTPDNSHTFEAVFRTQTQIAYGAGRWNSLRNDPAVDEILWGFTYSTVGDDRVRPEHALLEGTTLPKDHQFWETHWPPNGWNCRCTTLELFEPEAVVEPGEPIEIDGVTYRPGPQAGFKFNPGKVFRDSPKENRPATPKPRKLPFRPDDEPRKTSGDPDTNLAADRVYTKLQEDLRSVDITPEEEFALDDYVGSGYEDINPVLRDELPPDPRSTRIIESVRSVIAKAPPTKRDMVLHRFAESFDPGWEVGQEPSIKGFTSTSLTPQEGFIPRDGVAYEVFVPKGSRGLLAGINRAEHEVLMDHEAEVRVLGVKYLNYQTGGEVRRIKVYQVEYLGQG